MEIVELGTNMKTIVIDPVTRIEGHAKISIFLDDAGEVADARFHVVEYRGFEKFCEGHPFTEMAGITARICGICPVSHLSSVNIQASIHSIAFRLPYNSIAIISYG
jgi:coenzyme F420-reducing hydrogenase alpha subunit